MAKETQKKEILVLLDSHAIIHRAYHALPQTFTAPDGSPTNALYGLSAFLIRVLKELKPDYIAAAYDLPEPTFRHIAYKEYKSHRKETADDLGIQINKSKEILSAFKIPVFEFPGFEADDILGTIVEKLKAEKKLKVIIASGDNDTLQLVRGNDVVVYTLKKGINETTVYNEENVKKRFGFAPKLIPDYKGLCGDASDNIIGVKGIGEKTAVELIQKFNSISGIYKALQKNEDEFEKQGFKKRAVSLLKEQKEEALFSRELAEIRRDAPIEFSLDFLRVNGRPKKEEIMKIFEDFGFRSLIPRLNEIEYFFKPPLNLTHEGSLELSAPSFGEFKETAENHDEIFWIYEPALVADKNNKGEEPKIFAILSGGKIFEIKKEDALSGREFLNKLFREKKNFGFKTKEARHFFADLEITADFSFDLGIGMWILNSRFSNPGMAQIFSECGEDFGFGAERFKSYSRVFEIKNKILSRLESEDLLSVFQNIEIPLVKTLAKMERLGILIDLKGLKKISEACDKELKILEQKIWEAAGEKFNINSTKELRRILFEKLAIEVKGIKKTEGGVRSTKFSELVKIKGRHPMIEDLISYRELAKLKSTYIDTLPNLTKEDGRIHTSFNQQGTVTGRLSSSEPNLQNIPVKGELGKRIRDCFVSENGFKLVSFDYSQVELRAAALISGDKKMTEAFREGKDIHTATASEIFNTPLKSVTSDMRRKAKVINFGILYGMGANSISENLKIPKKEAEEYKNEYFKDFEGIAEYIINIIEEARANGFVKTLFGRKRRFDEIYSGNSFAAREAERMAINMPIQGTSADIIKIAMVKIDEFLEKNKLEEKARMLLQIHDELLFEIKDEFLEDAVEIIKNIMEGVTKPYSPEIPFPVEVSIGNSWVK